MGFYTAAFGALATIATRKLSSSNTITWSSIKTWIDGHCSVDDLNRGSAGNQLNMQPQRIFAEIRRGKSSSGKIQVTAAVVFNQNQGAAFRQSWDGAKIDKDLTKRFGDGNSFRISL